MKQTMTYNYFTRIKFYYHLSKQIIRLPKMCPNELTNSRLSFYFIFMSKRFVHNYTEENKNNTLSYTSSTRIDLIRNKM